MKIIPASRTVVIEPTKLPDTYAHNVITGVVVSDKDQPEIGRVIAIGGSTKKNDPPIKLKRGDIVAYRKYGESKFYLGGEEVMFISFDDILAVIKKGK